MRALLPDTTTDILPCRTWRGLPLLGCPGLVQSSKETTQLVMLVFIILLQVVLKVTQMLGVLLLVVVVELLQVLTQ